MFRNYRELTASEIGEIERLYPVTPNREIARRYDISVDALQDYIAYPRGWKKDRKAVLIGNRNGRSLTEKEVQWIVRHYRHTKNDDIMAKFGIGENSLHRVARKYGLTKSRQHMKKMQWNATCHAHEACRRYGVYEETSIRMKKEAEERKARGERIPGSFMPGQSNRDRLTKKRFKECYERIHEKRRETIRKERLRIKWGLPQKTKMKLVSGGRKRACYRHLLRKKNYIVGRGENDVYYDEHTDRRPKMEANAHKFGLRVVGFLQQSQ